MTEIFIFFCIGILIYEVIKMSFLFTFHIYHMQAHIYQELGYTSERNKCAMQFRQLDQQYPTALVPPMNTLWQDGSWDWKMVSWRYLLHPVVGFYCTQPFVIWWANGWAPGTLFTVGNEKSYMTGHLLVEGVAKSSRIGPIARANIAG